MIVMRDWTPTNVALLALVVLASFWTIASGLQAAALDPLPHAAADQPTGIAVPHSLSPAPPATGAVLAAVRANPMRPDRQRADGRYGHAKLLDTAQPEPRAPIPTFRVVGIARQRDGSDLVAIGWDRSPSRLVREGDVVQGFVMHSIRGDSVFLSRADTAIALAVPGPTYTKGAGR